ncbi:MAG: LysR family transcriptional regulator [Paracoccaceae bacterium]
MNFRDLEYVIAVAEHQNFTRAAKAVAVSQPALSNQIKKLEAELGVAIFDRGKDGVSLTAFGADMLAHAEQISGIVTAIGDLARKHQSAGLPPLRLGMTPTLAAYLSRFFRDYFDQAVPDQKIVIVEEYPIALSKMVEDRAVDMAFIARKSFETIYSNEVRMVEFTSLWLETVYLAVRTGHPLSEQASIYASEVPADHLIRFDIPFGYGLERDLPRPAEASAEMIGIDVKTARFETVCRHVAQSDTCTIVNAIAAEQFRSDGFGLHFIPFADDGNMRELGVLTRAEFPQPDLIADLCRHICQNPPRGTVGTCTASCAGVAEAG